MAAVKDKVVQLPSISEAPTPSTALPSVLISGVHTPDEDGPTENDLNDDSNLPKHSTLTASLPRLFIQTLREKPVNQRKQIPGPLHASLPNIAPVNQNNVLTAMDPSKRTKIHQAVHLPLVNSYDNTRNHAFMVSTGRPPKKELVDKISKKRSNLATNNLMSNVIGEGPWIIGTNSYEKMLHRIEENSKLARQMDTTLLQRGKRLDINVTVTVKEFSSDSNGGTNNDENMPEYTSDTPVTAEVPRPKKRNINLLMSCYALDRPVVSEIYSNMQRYFDVTISHASFFLGIDGGYSAIEDKDLVLICYDDAYASNGNCIAEAHKIMAMMKPFVFVQLEPRTKAKKWVTNMMNMAGTDDFLLLIEDYLTSTDSPKQSMSKFCDRGLSIWFNINSLQYDQRAQTPGSPPDDLEVGRKNSSVNKMKSAPLTKSSAYESKKRLQTPDVMPISILPMNLTVTGTSRMPSLMPSEIRQQPNTFKFTTSYLNLNKSRLVRSSFGGDGPIECLERPYGKLATPRKSLDKDKSGKNKEKLMIQGRNIVTIKAPQHSK